MFAALTLALVFTSPVPKAGPVDPPKTPPPVLEFLKFDGESATRLHTVTEAVPVQKEVQVTVLVNGQPQTETRTVVVTEARTKAVSTSLKWDLKLVTFATVGGKKLTAKEAGEKLKDGGVCVMATADKPIDPSYLSVLKEDIVIVTRPTAMVALDSVPGITLQPLPPPPISK